MKEEIIEMEEFKFVIFRHNEQEIQQINEAKNKGRHLTATYSYEINKPHNPNGEYHLHLDNKGNEILSINKVSGTAHDGYHGIRIPNKAFKALKSKLPDWNWPNNQILESENYTYILYVNYINPMRPVKVFNHKNYEVQPIEEFIGFFHQFADDPFRVGGGGFKVRTVALIENEDGYILKVPVTSFKFID